MNLIRYVICQFRSVEGYWKLISKPDPVNLKDSSQFLQMLTSLDRWGGGAIPHKVGTVRLKKAVTLLPKQEHLVWGKLQGNVSLSVGNTVVVEPTIARVRP